ncbi:MAG TPA: ZIP family metal transporter [Actinomycetota bacterium]
MSFAQTLGLGAIAGVTIFLGLPLGRAPARRAGAKSVLNGFSAGILLFLLVDILTHAGEPLEEAVEEHEWLTLAAAGAVYALGLGIGLLSVHGVSASRRKRRLSMGPGAMATQELAGSPRVEALNLGMTIAAGIGLHNFAEGLAIGQSAAAGEVSLALLLVIGFALHNATEGFGIVGPLAAAGERAPWRWLALAGLVGGGPTFLGTLVGRAFTSELIFVAFLALAAGGILYVIGEIFATGRRLSWTLMLWGMLAGLLLSVATELVLETAVA